MARLVEIGVRFNQHIAEVNDVLRRRRGRPRRPARRVPRRPRPRRRRPLPHHDGVPGRRAVPRERPQPERRQELTRLFNNRAADTNRPLLAEAVALRERVAELFGRPSWAHHTMDEKMAHDPETVDGFYDDLVPALTKKATDEIAVMAAPPRRRRAATTTCSCGTGATTTPSCARPSTASTATPSPPTSRCSRCSTGCSRSPARCSALEYRPLDDVAGVAPRRPQLRDRRPGDRRARSPSPTWTSTRARASSATPPRSTSCPAGGSPTAPTARRCRRSSPTSPSRPPTARRCCCTTRSSRCSTSSATSSTRR